MTRERAPARRRAALGCVVGLLLAAAPVSLLADCGDLRRREYDVLGQRLVAYALIPDRVEIRGTVVFVSGFPPAELGGDLGIRRAACDAGWVALQFQPRGTWESEGAFSFLSWAVDLQTIVRTAAAELDGPVAVIGHSAGGLMAVGPGSEIEAARCVASIAGPNAAVMGEVFAASAEVREAWERQFDGLVGPDRPVRNGSSRTFAGQLIETRDRYRFEEIAVRLAGKPTLLVAATGDAVVRPQIHHDPLVEALRVATYVEYRAVKLDTDHDFGSAREELLSTIVEWLQEDCAGA